MARPHLRKRTFPLLAALGLIAAPAHASDAIWLRGTYVVSLAGLSVGRGGWDVRLEDGRFAVTGHARTAGMLRLFSSGQGEASAAGAMRDGRPVAERYDYLSHKSTKFDEVRLRLRDGQVTEARIEPPSPARKTRVALSEEHRAGIVDPVSGVLMAVSHVAATSTPDACARVVPVFDGRMRYDLHFAYKRTETVRTPHGYHGPAVVCGVRFVPIAGHVPERATIRYLMGLDSIEAWLAPVGGLRLVVPWRVVVPTPFGTAKMEAERFEVGLE